MMIMRFPALLVLPVLGLMALLACEAHAAAAPPARAAAFLEAHCIACHDADTKKGNLDLTALPFNLADTKTFERWVKVYDRVHDGEMPPAKTKVRPDAASLNAFLGTIAGPMVAADQTRATTEGRAVRRRLNRYEYENTLRDLLRAPWLQIKPRLPEDGESHRFNKSGEALDISHVQMASYLGAAEYALREVTATSSQAPAKSVRRYYTREQKSFAGKVVFTQFNGSPERATFPLIDYTADIPALKGTGPMTVGKTDPAKREHEAMGVVASSYEPLDLRWNQFEAPVSGRYKLRFSTYTFWAGPKSPEKWWTPDREHTSKGRRSEPVVIYAETPPRLLRWIGNFDAQIEPGVAELDVYLLAGETIRPDAARLFRSRPPAWHNPLAEKDGQPGVAFKWLEVEGPIVDQWPTAGHKLLFGDLPITKAGESGDSAEVKPKDPLKDGERLLRNFMAAAYRGPVAEADVQRFLGVIKAAQKANLSFSETMNAAYSAVLCSPEFVTVVEKPGKLDDFALATRLALFLWNSAPDEELRKLAAAGELHKPDVLRKQTDRLLSDPKSRRFVDAFTDYWLDLRKIINTAPDAGLYPDYYLDDLLTDSSEQETQLFFAELIKANLPAKNIVSSDFAMLNERLAKHYGLPPVQGVAIRRVQLPKDTVRGGLMTQASVLKVTANGTTTSPVLRGAWIMERILGKPPPPPPPSVPAIEPDTRGATTIRQQLDKHRAIASCAACHTKIDPAGFALENFDVMGGWRETYRGLGGEGVAVAGFGHNGQKFTFHAGPTVDASGMLPGGGDFKDIRDLKALLLKDEPQIARNLVGQLVTYSTGAPIRFGDRPAVEQILKRSAPSGYGVRTLIHEIVQSELFQIK